MSKPPPGPPFPPVLPGHRPDPLELGEEIHTNAQRLLSALRSNDPIKTTTDLMNHITSGLQALDAVLRQPIGRRKP